MPSILVRSFWQTVNIGDIGHTPGLLALLEKHLPEVEERQRATMNELALNFLS